MAEQAISCHELDCKMSALQVFMLEALKTAKADVLLAAPNVSEAAQYLKGIAGFMPHLNDTNGSSHSANLVESWEKHCRKVVKEIGEFEAWRNNEHVLKPRIPESTANVFGTSNATTLFGKLDTSGKEIDRLKAESEITKMENQALKAKNQGLSAELRICTTELQTLKAKAQALESNILVFTTNARVWETENEVLKKEITMLRAKHERDLKIREPLLQVGIAVRRRFIEHTMSAIKDHLQPVSITIKKGNEAFYHGNYLADSSLFTLEILKSTQQKENFKSMYSVFPGSLELASKPQPALVIQISSHRATMRSYRMQLDDDHVPGFQALWEEIKRKRDKIKSQLNNGHYSTHSAGSSAYDQDPELQELHRQVVDLVDRAIRQRTGGRRN